MTLAQGTDEALRGALPRAIPHSMWALLTTPVALPALQLALEAPWMAQALGVLVAGAMFASSE